MNVTVEITDRYRNVHVHKVRRSYLAVFVKPEGVYQVPYSIVDNKRIDGEVSMLGADLTENQIAWLFAHEKL